MKRDPITIMEQIFEALEQGRPFTLNELSKETGIHSLTLKRYIRLVTMVRREPDLEVIRTRHSVVIRIVRTASVAPSGERSMEKNEDI